MNSRAFSATTIRILKQLKADPRTVAMIVLVPTILMTLLYFIYQNVPAAPGQLRLFNRVGVSMLGILPFVVMFLITAIATLGAFLYNIVASLVGGLQLTLTDD